MGQYITRRTVLKWVFSLREECVDCSWGFFPHGYAILNQEEGGRKLGKHAASTMWIQSKGLEMWMKPP